MKLVLVKYIATWHKSIRISNAFESSIVPRAGERVRLPQISEKIESVLYDFMWDSGSWQPVVQLHCGKLVVSKKDFNITMKEHLQAGWQIV
jgi:hypothetical protein